MTEDDRPLYKRSLTSQIASLGTTPSILLPPREFTFSPALTPPRTPSSETSDDLEKFNAFDSKSNSANPVATSPYAHLASSSAHLDLLTSLHPTFDQPISTLLRVGTQKAHALAEHSDGAKALIAGTLSEEEYLRYLVLLWMMYRGLEGGMEGVRSVAVKERGSVGRPDGQKEEREKRGVDGVNGIWKRRKLLSRLRGLESDIQTFTTRLTTFPNTSSSSRLTPSLHPSFPFPIPTYLHSTLSSPPPALEKYISRLAHLAHHEPGRLIAHAYVRYLGDLSGGQLVAQRIKRTYSLALGSVKTDRIQDGTLFPPGTKFYEFDFDAERSDHSDTTSAGTSGWQDEKPSLKESIDEVKGWFRETMDLAVGADEEMKAALVDEAITAFQLSTSLFSLLSAPSPSAEPESKPSNTLTPPTTPPTFHTGLRTIVVGSKSSTRLILTYTTYALLGLAIIVAICGTDLRGTTWWKALHGVKAIGERFSAAR